MRLSELMMQKHDAEMMVKDTNPQIQGAPQITVY